MIVQLIPLCAFFALGSCVSIQKNVNPCGIVYSTGTFNHHGIRSAFQEMSPRVSELLHMLKSIHHHMMEEYQFSKSWIPDDNSLAKTESLQETARQLPDIYKSLLHFSYALDFIYEDNIKQEKNELCFFFVDTLPNVIDKHRELICATDAAMGKLNMEIPDIDALDLPSNWAQSMGNSCVDKFFRLSEIHTKYRKFLATLHHLLHK